MVIKMHWLRALGYAAWALVTLTLAIGWYVEHQGNVLLRENKDLARRALVAQDQLCGQVQRINDICAGQFIELMQRLGLDNEMMPLMTTALWKYATRGMRVSEARKKLGAKPYATGFLTREQMDTAAVGGPDDDSALPPLPAK